MRTEIVFFHDGGFEVDHAATKRTIEKTTGKWMGIMAVPPVPKLPHILNTVMGQRPEPPDPKAPCTRLPFLSECG